MSACLSYTQIIAYYTKQGEVPAGAEDHLRNCEQCQAKLQQVQSDDTLALDIRLANEETRKAGNPPLPIIRDYGLVREIGRGGGGVVYEAIQRSLNRSVALKILPSLVQSVRPESAERFKAEAEAAARLQHPNIVPIFDYGEEGGCHYYAMELVLGAPFSWIIKHYAVRPRVTGDNGDEQGLEPDDPPGSDPMALATLPLPQTETAYYRAIATWVADVAAALHYAHQRGLIHRDIKPSNLILSTSGQIMITDFGLVKELGSEGETCSGHLMGTLRYMSPEQMLGRPQEVDHRTDIYSLGVTLYEMLVLQPALPGKDDHSMIQRVLEYQPSRPHRLVPTVPKDLAMICSKAMSKDKVLRYQDAEAFRADLLRFLHDEPIMARPPRMAIRAAKFIRRNRLMVLLLLMSLFLTTSVLFAALFFDAHRQNLERNTAVTAELVTAAKAHFDQGRYNVAVSVYTRALERDSNLAYVYIARSDAYGALGRLDLAIDDLSSAIELSPGRPYSYFRRGLFNLMVGDVDSAVVDIDQALAILPSLFEARVLRYFLSVQYEPDTERIALLPPGFTASDTFYAALVECLTGDGNPQAMLALADSARNHVLAFVALGEQALVVQDVAGARQYFSQCVQTAGSTELLRPYCQWRLDQLASNQAD